MKTKLVSCASTLFFLAVFSCEHDKPDPECRDASCCSPFANKYVEYLVDEPVALIGPPYYAHHSFLFSRKFPSKSDGKYLSNISNICSKSFYKIGGLPVTNGKKNESNAFPYRVSGKLLDWTGERLVHRPILTLYIDKIEKIN